MESNMTDIEQTILAIAKDGAREHQLRFADNYLSAAKELLHDAHWQFYSGAPMNEVLLNQRVLNAMELVGKALEMVRAAK